jgi:hypothetical protein
MKSVVEVDDSGLKRILVRVLGNMAYKDRYVCMYQMFLQAWRFCTHVWYYSFSRDSGSALAGTPACSVCPIHVEVVCFI